jgi:hypothetical protein
VSDKINPATTSYKLLRNTRDQYTPIYNKIGFTKNGRDEVHEQIKGCLTVILHSSETPAAFEKLKKHFVNFLLQYQRMHNAKTALKQLFNCADETANDTYNTFIHDYYNKDKVTILRPRTHKHEKATEYMEEIDTYLVRIKKELENLHSAPFTNNNPSILSDILQLSHQLDHIATHRTGSLQLNTNSVNKLIAYIQRLDYKSDEKSNQNKCLLNGKKDFNALRVRDNKPTLMDETQIASKIDEILDEFSYSNRDDKTIIIKPEYHQLQPLLHPSNKSHTGIEPNKVVTITSTDIKSIIHAITNKLDSIPLTEVLTKIDLTTLSILDELKASHYKCKIMKNNKNQIKLFINCGGNHSFVEDAPDVANGTLKSVHKNHIQVIIESRSQSPVTANKSNAPVNNLFNNVASFFNEKPQPKKTYKIIEINHVVNVHKFDFNRDGHRHIRNENNKTKHISRPGFYGYNNNKPVVISKRDVTINANAATKTIASLVIPDATIRNELNEMSDHLLTSMFISGIKYKIKQTEKLESVTINVMRKYLETEKLTLINLIDEYSISNAVTAEVKSLLIEHIVKNKKYASQLSEIMQTALDVDDEDKMNDTLENSSNLHKEGYTEYKYATGKYYIPEKLLQAQLITKVTEFITLSAKNMAIHTDKRQEIVSMLKTYGVSEDDIESFEQNTTDIGMICTLNLALKSNAISNIVALIIDNNNSIRKAIKLLTPPEYDIKRTYYMDYQGEELESALEKNILTDEDREDIAIAISKQYENSVKHGNIFDIKTKNILIPISQGKIKKPITQVIFIDSKEFEQTFFFKGSKIKLVGNKYDLLDTKSNYEHIKYLKDRLEKKTPTNGTPKKETIEYFTEYNPHVLKIQQNFEIIRTILNVLYPKEMVYLNIVYTDQTFLDKLSMGVNKDVCDAVRIIDDTKKFKNQDIDILNAMIAYFINKPDLSSKDLYKLIAHRSSLIKF